jgi:hypothetical protein
MIRRVLTLVLATMSGNSTAAWVDVGVKSNSATLYVDSARIHKSGSIVRVWSLIGLKTAEHSPVQNKWYLSQKEEHEFDCSQKRSRHLYSAWYSGHMGDGNVVAEDSMTSGWKPIASDSVSVSLWQFACLKR